MEKCLSDALMKDCAADNAADTTSFVTASSPLFLYSTFQKACSRVKNNSQRKVFPSWDTQGIAIQPILGHIDRFLDQDVSLNGVQRHFGKEIFYVLDETGVWGTQVLRDQYRVLPSEALLSWAHKELTQVSKSGSSNRWRNLVKAFQSTGVPFWAWYGDWKSCNYRNFGNFSVPVFTTCAKTSCNYTFPTPSYMNIIDSQPDTSHWYYIFDRSHTAFPWKSKVRKVVWRGSLSESDPSKALSSQRWRLTQLVHELKDPIQKAMFDVGLTAIPGFLTAQMNIDASVVGSLVPGISMNDFQKYIAILDMDGSSWSSRFRFLLCSNSVVVKVEPEYVDYFYYDLVPWKHYIPIKGDLSDLVETVAFVTDPANDVVIQEIMLSANHWCSERSTHRALVADMFDTWETYIEWLDRADPQWSEHWSNHRSKLMEQRHNNNNGDTSQEQQQQRSLGALVKLH